MRAVYIIDQMRELIARDRLLVMFENVPSRPFAEDVNVVGTTESGRKDRDEYD